MDNNINNRLNNNEMPQPQNIVSNNMNTMPSSEGQMASTVVPNDYSNYQASVSQPIEKQVMAESSQGVSANLEQLASTLYNQMVENPVAPSQVEVINETQGMPNVAVDVTVAPAMSISELDVVEIPGMPSSKVDAVEISKVPTQTIDTSANLSESVNNSTNNKVSNRKILFIILGIVVLIVIIGTVTYFMTKKDEKELKPQPKPEEPVVEKDWDPSTSKIKINSNATKLVCSMENDTDGTINRITYTHVYNNDEYIQVVVEDEMIFNEETFRYYDYYVGSALEEVEYQEQLYDNIIIEVRQKKMAVSLAYSFDLTASEENPKNMLDNRYMTIEEMKTNMLNMGFTCE